MNEEQETEIRNRKKSAETVDNSDTDQQESKTANLLNLNIDTLPATHNYGSAAEYAEAVRAWIWAYHNWQLNKCIMHFILHEQYQTSLSPAPVTQATTGPILLAQSVTQPAPAPSTHQRGIQYTIPHFGRRILAELIDGIFCFMISLFLTFVLVEIGLIDSEKYEKILNYEADLNVVINITQDLFPLEILLRLLTSFVEATYLSRGIGAIPAGQTPGKYVLGLKVIPCQEIEFVSVRDGIVSVYSPVTTIGFKRALMRSVIKNYAMHFFFPLCVVMYVSRFNRSLYDVASDTVVVEA